MPEQPRASVLHAHVEGQVLGVAPPPDDPARQPLQLGAKPELANPHPRADTRFFGSHVLSSRLVYPTGWYLRCHIRKQCPTKIMACSTPIPSSLSLSYSA